MSQGAAACALLDTQAGCVTSDMQIDMLAKDRIISATQQSWQTKAEHQLVARSDNGLHSVSQAHGSENLATQASNSLRAQSQATQVDTCHAKKSCRCLHCAGVCSASKSPRCEARRRLREGPEAWSALGARRGARGPEVGVAGGSVEAFFTPCFCSCQSAESKNFCSCSMQQPPRAQCLLLHQSPCFQSPGLCGQHSSPRVSAEVPSGSVIVTTGSWALVVQHALAAWLLLTLGIRRFLGFMPPYFFASMASCSASICAADLSPLCQDTSGY